MCRLPERPTVVVTDSTVHVPKLHAIANVIQYQGSGEMPRDKLLQSVHHADAIFCLLRDKIDKEVLDHANKLKFIGTMSVGFEHIDLEECRKRNIKVGHTPDVSTESVAELGVALLLTTARRVPETMNAAKNGEWPVWSPFWMCGREIYGSTIGFYGCGRIGESMAEKLLPFKPKRIIYHNKNKKSNSSLEYVSFGELLSESDFLIIGVNCTPETKGKFDCHTLNKMKKGAILINISRGAIVKSMDLYEALINGHLQAAGLDVTDPEPLPPSHPLFSLPNCVILPHVGSATYGARVRMNRLTEDNIYYALLGEEMPAPVS